MKLSKKSIAGGLAVFFVFIVLALSCSTVGGLSGNVPDSYSEIVRVSGDKDELFTKASLSLVDFFVDSDCVIEYSDKQAGVLKGKYVTPVSVGNSNYRTFSIIEVDVKDGKYRMMMKFAAAYTLGNGFIMKSGTPVPANDGILESLNVEWKALAQEFKAAMNSDTSW